MADGMWVKTIPVSAGTGPYALVVVVVATVVIMQCPLQCFVPSNEM